LKIAVVPMGVVCVYKMANDDTAVCLMANQIAREDEESSAMQLLLLLQHR